MNAANLKDALRAFLRLWVLGTLALWIPGLLGWINDVTSWARGQGATPFPDAHGLAYLFVAAITSAFVAAMAGAVRFLENWSGKTVPFLPRAAGPQTVTPPPAPGEGGATDTRVIAVVALVVAVVVLIILLN